MSDQSNAQKDPDQWVTGDEAMTGAQRSYLETLSQESGEPFDASLSKADAGNYETFAIGWSGRVDPDGNIYQFVSTTGSQNDSGYSNPRLDLILNNARKASTEHARKTLYRAAQKIMLNDRPLIYLYHAVARASLEKRLVGVKMYPDTLLRVSLAGYK